MKFLNRSECDRVKEVDRDCRTKFYFCWMEDIINYEEKFSVQKRIYAGAILKKPDIPGKCYCEVCDCLMNYNPSSFFHNRTLGQVVLT